MLNGNVLGLVPFVLICGMVLGIRLGKRYNRWLMRVFGALSVVAGFACLGFIGPFLAYNVDYKTLWVSNMMKHDVFNSLVFNFAAMLLAFGLGTLLRSIARGKAPADDMFNRENEKARSVKMAVIAFLGGGFFLSIAALAVWIYVTIEDHTHVKMPLFPYLITWGPTLALMLYLEGRNRLNPAREAVPALLVKWMFILLGASVLFAMTGIEM